ncbi:putative multiple sugar transport system substrate-binding protein [Butyrivibrio fibrisolvens DSM 3071]|uniref:Putative multiple sugar transport system substrate-binding protein n=1 Tax=Butyrivibrio fibrisolvens DSM 3071 TaxID=1121131 RepID=A0A1M5V1I0_BUTFI|nr:sugar-binding protein [Butyrivibrio fibrisolvens]SHH69157.1 putative multiple sugar transport system substrate-binding protein [Butyrivibrio fibrisolvens DSM 3071]
MKKQLLKQVLSLGMAAALLVGCSGGATDGGNAGGGDGGEQTQQTTDGGSASGVKVGVSMPTKDLQRWNQDGDNMQKELEAAGYTVDLQYASNDVQQQLSQVETMINNQVDVLVIAAIEGSSLGEALDMAKTAGIPVIAYDRLIMNSDAVSYYATFDNYQVGVVQANYIIEKLDLENTDKTYNLEITAGDPGDNNAMFFYNGAVETLQKYIDEGKLVIPSGQKEFEDVATAVWATETAQSRAENILSSYYADGTNVDVWLCSNDSTALGVENALAANYNGEYPIVTGQDCDIENTKNMIAGKQSMSVFKDTRTLASQVVKMVTQIVNNETVDVNDTTTYNNGVITVPSFLCEPVFADASNYKELLIDSGYYTEDQLK